MCRTVAVASVATAGSRRWAQDLASLTQKHALVAHHRPHSTQVQHTCLSALATCRALFAVDCLQYASWEESQKDFRRARSVWERAIDVDYTNVTFWLKVGGCVCGGGLSCDRLLAVEAYTICATFDGVLLPACDLAARSGPSASAV